MFPDGSEFYLDIKDGERGYNSDPARGADTFSPFSRKMSTKSNVRNFNNGTTSDDIVCTTAGYVYIFINVISNGPLVPYTIKRNNEVIYNSSAGKGCHELTPIKVKKDDTISWTFTTMDNIFGATLCIVYPT